MMSNCVSQTIDILNPISAQKWRANAACWGWDTNIFYPGRGDSKNVKLAQSICASCSVKKECLEFAVDNNMTEGIWGGLTGRQMRSYRRKLKLNTPTYERE
jgi:WhiB family redox-sensing transcriptional regulator